MKIVPWLLVLLALPAACACVAPHRSASRHPAPHHPATHRSASRGGRASAAAGTVGEIQADGILCGVADRLWAQNDVYWHQGDYPRIIAQDRIIVQADPQFIECYNTGAWLLWSSGRDGEAEAFYKQCIANNPDQAVAYFDYGFFLYNHLHRYDDARQVYARSTRLPDAGVLDLRMLAHAYEKLGRYDRAVGVWRGIKARWPQGAPQDNTHGVVDTNNLNKDLRFLSRKDLSEKDLRHSAR